MKNTSWVFHVSWHNQGMENEPCEMLMNHGIEGHEDVMLRPRYCNEINHGKFGTISCTPI